MDVPTADTGKGSARTGNLVAGGAGAIGGAGVSAGLFSAIGMGKILSSPVGFSPTYALVVFSMAALFILVAALFTIQVSRAQRTIVILGLACFLILALAGAAITFYQDYERPSIQLIEQFEPDNLAAADLPVPLKLMYRADHSEQSRGTYVPFAGGPFTVLSGDTVALRMDGFDNLISKYRETASESQDFSLMLDAVCGQAPEASSQVCQIRREKMTVPKPW